MSKHIMTGMYNLAIDQMEIYHNDLSDNDIKKVFPPMNCIGWLIGHSARYNYAVANKVDGVIIPEDVEKFSNGQPHSTPDLEFIINLWNKSVKVVKKSLSEVTDLDLETKITWVNKNKNWDVNQDEKINLGTDLARYLFHYWNHLGEIASVRQLLGKDPGNPGYGKWDWRY